MLLAPYSAAAHMLRGSGGEGELVSEAKYFFPAWNEGVSLAEEMEPSLPPQWGDSGGTPNHHLCLCPRAAVTSYCKPGGLKQQRLSLSQFRRLEV